MSIRRKGRRRIIVGGRRYTWYVAPDDDSPLLMLQIVSEDKYLILTCPLRTDPVYVISKGRCFQARPSNGLWNRYMLPFALPDAITPEFVAKLIVWATRHPAAIPVANRPI